MLVNAKVRHVLSDGLLVSFLTFFNGTIDCFHLHQVGPRLTAPRLLRWCVGALHDNNITRFNIHGT